MAAPRPRSGHPLAGLLHGALRNFGNCGQRCAASQWIEPQMGPRQKFRSQSALGSARVFARLLLLATVCIGAHAMGSESQTNWWSLQPLRKPAVPRVQDKSWPRTPIDYFILKTLET